MKKTILLLVFCTIQSGLLLGQINKGKFLIGLSTDLNVAGSEGNPTSIGFTKSVDKSDNEPNNNGILQENKSFGLNLSPKVGYFVANNFSVGLLANYSFSHTNYDDGSATFSSNAYNLGPFIRYYIPTKRVWPFFELGSTFGGIFSRYENTNFNAENEGRFWTSMVNAGIGMAVPLGEKVNFDILVGYENHFTKLKKNNKHNVRNIYQVIGLDLGFTVILGKSE